MRKILSFLLTAIVIISCENTDEPEKDYYKIIGCVNIKLDRVHESGRILGSFSCGYYLAGIEVELIQNGEVVESTQTIEDTSSDMLYLFEKMELNKPYRVKIKLNDEMIEITDEFVIKAEDIKEFPNDSVGEANFSKPEWIKKDIYYIDMLWMSEKNISFDLYTDREKINVYPNPFQETGWLGFSTESADNVEIDIYDIRLNKIMLFYRNSHEPGNYLINFGNEIYDGLYLIKLITGGKTYYCPFLKGQKGAP
ncbi:T9SS type A sorting domain-containing protein [Bacteroidota bacterium]